MRSYNCVKSHKCHSATCIPDLPRNIKQARTETGISISACYHPKGVLNREYANGNDSLRKKAKSQSSCEYLEDYLQTEETVQPEARNEETAQLEMYL